MNKHIEFLSQKLAKANGVISKFRHYVTPRTCRQVYFAIFHSNFLYGCLSWSFTSQENLNKIYVHQKSFLRLITFSSYNDPTEQFFLSCKILKLFDVLEFEIVKFMFEFVNDTIPSSLHFIFNQPNYSNNYDTRFSYLMHLLSYNTIHFGKNIG